MKKYTKHGNPKKKKKDKKKKWNYYEYIDSKKWAKRRRRFFKKYGNSCRICGSKYQVTLHHLTYKNLGHEEDEELIPLCWECHGELHEECGHDYRKGMDFIINKQEEIEFREKIKNL